MPLVAYASSSSSSSDNETSLAHKRRRNNGSSTDRSSHAPASQPVKRAADLPPLPASFHNLYATNTRVSTRDDPALHAGRKRQVPHIEGNWPSHVFIEWHPPPTHTTTLSTLVTSVASANPSLAIHSSLASDLGVPLPLHISLSAPLTLRSEQRTTFAAQIEQRVRRACPVSGFSAQLHGLDWASNGEGTRWFLALRLREVGDGVVLSKLLAGCNAVAAEYGQPQLYDGPAKPDTAARARHGKQKHGTHGTERESVPDKSDRFHFSIGWTLKNPLTDGSKIGPVALGDEEALRAVEDITLDVDVVKIKIGNAVTSVDLRRAVG